MTPAEEDALLNEVGAAIEAAAAQAFAEYRRLVLDGMPPREAVTQAMSAFNGDLAEHMAAAFSAILSESVGTASVLAMTIGTVTLSQALYVNTEALATTVQGIVQRHVDGFTDARALAFELYEGYGFRPFEVLEFNPQNPLLPKYLREALLPDLASEFEAAFARIQVDNLTTAELKAAYRQVLAAIDAIKDGAGDDLLMRRLRVAFEEKARYLVKRIAQTELHRAFAERQAKELMQDEDVEWVQWRMSATHPREDICDFFAGVDRYGKGKGIYPKAAAPVPTAHPFCRCVLAPRLDLTGSAAAGVADDGASARYFGGLGEREAARVAGSYAKLQQIIDGADPLEVHNAGIPEAYRVRTVAEVAAD